jgi:hypothetical protein
MFKLSWAILIRLGQPDGLTISQLAAEINAANANAEWGIALGDGQCLN